MKNVKTVIKDNTLLIIKIDLSKEFGQSKSGKTTIIATTGGNVPIKGYEDKEVKIGLNVYKPYNKDEDDGDDDE